MSGRSICIPALHIFNAQVKELEGDGHRFTAAAMNVGRIIAQAANQNGVSWEAVKSIAQEARCGYRTAQRAIARWSALGVFDIKQAASRWGTNIYRLVRWGLGLPEQPRECRTSLRKKSTGVFSQCHLPLVDFDTPTPAMVADKQYIELSTEQFRRDSTFTETTNHQEPQRERQTQEKNRKFGVRDDRPAPPAPTLSPGFLDEWPAAEPDVIPELPADFEWAPPPGEPFPGDLDDNTPGDPPPEQSQPSRRPDPPRHTRPEPDPVQRQATAKREELNPRMMVEIWNAAMKGTPIPRVRDLTPSRERKLRDQARSPLRHSVKAWETVCAYIAGSPFFRGERRAGAYATELDQILAENRPLRILEEMQTRAEAYDAELKAQGIYNPGAEPEMPARMVSGRPVTPPGEAKVDVTDLPVLTRKEILAIEPTLKTEMGPESSNPAREAQVCRAMVLMMRATGTLPSPGGGKPMIEVRH